MRQIVFDIETCAYPFESLSESQREYLLRYAEKETDIEKRTLMIDDAVKYTALYPFTAKCIAIGILDVQKGITCIYYESAEYEEWTSEDKTILYKGMSETEILESFWRIAEQVNQFITFNGRNFDAPFLMLRSAILKKKISKNLMGYRYGDTHIDLLEQFTFFGNTRKFNLDFYCNGFGIDSPKANDISGLEIKNLYESGRIREIAVYCSGDIRATYELFKIWEKFLRP